MYHAEKQGGIITQKLVAYYNCIGPFVVPDCKDVPELDSLIETRKGVAVSYSPSRNCKLNVENTNRVTGLESTASYSQTYLNKFKT